ncbi:MAG: F0F1 ATP synthase subunit delta [Methylovulum sp.]|nr:F0F1 ATP synthase subunit delta [Methylovulum sp.]
MSELATLARPYAAAVFKRAKETGATEKWSESLAFMSAVLSDSEISALFDNPKVSKQDISDFMLDICQGHVDEESSNFLKLLVHNNRLVLISTIFNLFEAYKADHEGYVEVEVTTAYEFSEETRLNFAATLEKTLGKKIHMNVILDKSLIGGVLVRAGDKVIDGSIRGQLQHMQKTLQ